MQLEGVGPVTFPSSIPLSAFLLSETSFVPWFWGHVSALDQLATCRVSETQHESHQPMNERCCNSHLLFPGRAIIAETFLGFYFHVAPYHYTFRALLNLEHNVQAGAA